MPEKRRPGVVVLGEDEIRLTSVGLDIGSATTQAVFSRIELVLKDSRYVPVKREILHASPVLLTPYIDATTLDAAALSTFVKEQYAAADLTPEGVDTGVVIMTGTALRRENAQAIGSALSLDGGALVSLAAGDTMEGMIAAHGSGAVEASSSGTPVLNIDIGGGTTKLSICKDRRVLQVAALDVGARLIVRDADSRIIRLEPAGKEIATELGMELSVGDRLEDDALLSIADAMARGVLAASGVGIESPYVDLLLRTPPLDLATTPRTAILSGGVSRYFSGESSEGFGDLGPVLAARLKELAVAGNYEIRPSEIGIRATVLGASQYTVQMSGATITVSPDRLPLRDVRVADPALDLAAEQIDPVVIATSVREALARVGRAEGEGTVAIRVAWLGVPSFGRLDGLARGIADGLDSVVRVGHPAIVVIDADIGRLVGSHLTRVLGDSAGVISVDGVELQELDFVDLGAIVDGSTALPVTIKSIMFDQSGVKR